MTKKRGASRHVVVAPLQAAPKREHYRPAWFNKIRASVQHSSNRVENWVTTIQRGELRLPKFQRTFVWTDEQILLLLKSLFAGDYVGSLLLWERYGVPPSPEVFGEITIEATEQGSVYYVIDGQQRLGALATAYLSGRFFLDVQDGTFSTADGPWKLPLAMSFNTGEQIDWIPSHAAKHGLDKERLFDCMIASITMLTDMEVSAILLPSHWARERVIETFVLINISGTPLTRDDLAVALAMEGTDS